MSAIIRGPQLARLLSAWQTPSSVRSIGGRRPEYVVLAGAVRGLLIDGRLALGVRLPAERELAVALGISRTTVTAAYRELRESGHLTSRRGAGSWTALPGGHRVGTSGLLAPSDDADLIDLGCAALPAPPELQQAAIEAVNDLPPYSLRRRLPADGHRHAAGADRRVVHRARPADRARADHDHRRRAAGAGPAAAVAYRAGRPRTGRDADLPERTHRVRGVAGAAQLVCDRPGWLGRGPVALDDPLDAGRGSPT